MLVNFPEYCLVVEDMNKVNTPTWSQLLFSPPRQSMEAFKPMINQKFSLIGLKDTALQNVAKKFDEVRDSNNKLLNKSLEVQKQAFLMRQNLELSILMSQSKKIDIEMEKLKTMNAETFIATYGL